MSSLRRHRPSAWLKPLITPFLSFPPSPQVSYVTLPGAPPNLSLQFRCQNAQYWAHEPGRKETVSLTSRHDASQPWDLRQGTFFLLVLSFFQFIHVINIS